uniref:Reverse transcriptase domain-containing protein n=1 Tax=Rhizophagus irregularis (strain DAOM 181602 / DAOM 197198 / MUCL 43194) TaxID=747089 RepID=U9UKR7_RHIID
MDDTTIISDSKDKLEKLISMCHSFFKINNIQANIQKYELIKINAKEKEDLNIEGVKIKKVNDEEGNRYLGFYFEYNNKRSIYKRKIKEIVDKAAKIMRFKMLTEKQVTAVWNMVNLPSSLPNYIMYDKDLIGLKNIYDLQSEMLSKNIIYYANSCSELSLLFDIQMRNLQLKYWTSYCLGEHGEVLTLGNNSYLGDALKILKENNLTICDPEIVDGRNYSIKGGNIKIEDIFTPLEYKKWKTSLKK